MNTLNTSSAKRSTVTNSSQRLTGLVPDGRYELAVTTATYVAQSDPAYDETYAELDCGDLADGDLDTVIRAADRGAAGNDLTVQLIGDGALASNVVINEATDNIVIHYESGVSTVADVETAIGLSTKLAVKTTGTGATVLTAPADNFAATALAGGGEDDLGSQNAPVASAGDGSSLVPAGGKVYLSGSMGSQIAVKRATADGECTLSRVVEW